MDSLVVLSGRGLKVNPSCEQRRFSDQGCSYLSDNTQHSSFIRQQADYSLEGARDMCVCVSAEGSFYFLLIIGQCIQSWNQHLPDAFTNRQLWEILSDVQAAFAVLRTKCTKANSRF